MRPCVEVEVFCAFFKIDEANGNAVGLQIRKQADVLFTQRRVEDMQEVLPLGIPIIDQRENRGREKGRIAIVCNETNMNGGAHMGLRLS